MGLPTGKPETNNVDGQAAKNSRDDLEEMLEEDQ